MEITSNLSLSPEELKQFDEQGFLGPYPLFCADETEAIFKRYFSFPRLMLPWVKGRHAVVKEMAKTAMHSFIVDRVSSILGQDILLWGSIIIRQKAAGKHPMHVDVEHVAWDGISVWLAMHNVVSGSSFSVISGSHLFKTSPQELNQTNELNLDDDNAVLEAAKKINPNSKLVHLEVSDGQFIIFNGKLWHGTRNPTTSPRVSIVFQYTSPESKVRIPKTYKLPGIQWYKKKPLCLLVHGQDKFRVNRLVDINRMDDRKNFFKGLFLYLPVNAVSYIKNRMKR